MINKFFKKKIGILTLNLNSNIGGNLQAYALMEKLRQLGHDPILINRRHPSKDLLNKLPDYYINKDVSLPLFSKFIATKDLGNVKFIDSYISPITPPFLWSDQLSNHIERYKFDAIIVGSDQVWRPRYAMNMLSDYFLGFLPDSSKIKRISYAASFGTSDWEFDEKLTLECSKLIQQFDAVSVREDSGTALCRSRLGVSAQHVLDPTLLLTPEHYVQKFSLLTLNPPKKNLLTYILDESADKTIVVNTLAERLSLKTYATNGLPFDANGATEGVGDQSVESWLASFYQADFVVTDSFHGTVFSILFNKPFIAYGNPKRGMARFTSLLKMLGLEDRLVLASSEINIDKMLEPIDWKKINRRIEELRMMSVGFLKSSLSEDSTASNIENSHPRLKVAEVNSHPLKVLCSGCGVCVSESNGTLAMKWNDDGFLVPVAISDNIPAQAIKVCPFNPKPEKDVEDEDILASRFLSTAKNFDAKIGRFESTFVGYSNRFRATSSSGGIATFVLEKLLKLDIVDYLYVVQKDGNSGYRYQVFHKNEDITSISKTRYYPVTLEKLFSTISETEGRVAVSGVPCFLKAIRLKQHYHPELKQKIPFLLGIFCGGLKSKHYTDFLAQSAGIFNTYSDSEYRVKDATSTANDYSFSALDAQGQSHDVKMSTLGDMWGTGMFKARSCDFCTDVVAELADISVGDAWLPEYKADGLGNSIIITRSQLADQIIQSGIQAGELVLDSIPANKVVQSQSGGFNHRHTGVGFRVWFAKNFTDMFLPVVRVRFQNKIALHDALIQVLRERTRSKSLRIWSQTKNISAFQAKMTAALRILKNAINAGRNRYDGALDTILISFLTKKQFDLRQSIQTIQNHPKEYLTPLRWLINVLHVKKQNYHVLRMALLDHLILAPEGINTMSNITQEMPESSQTKNKKVAFVKSTIAEFSDVPMWMVNALDIYKATNGQCVIDGNNKIIITGSKDATALRNTNIFLSGKKNEIVLHNLKNVTKLDVACVEGGKVHLGGPEKINKAVIMASHGSSVSVGNDCLISRDVIIYSSAAHAVYNLDGTHRGLKNITIGNKVWLGQGVRVLAGASVGDNSVIGSYSVLAGKISNNCAAAGNPCRVTTKDIFWTTSGSGSNLNYYKQATNRDKPSPSFIKKTKD
jgi:coenzyme F420-reducing hydrogenase beta subunit/acetyltransferase-like isoleucine patch superfamily enzyme